MNVLFVIAGSAIIAGLVLCFVALCVSVFTDKDDLALDLLGRGFVLTLGGFLAGLALSGLRAVSA